MNTARWSACRRHGDQRRVDLIGGTVARVESQIEDRARIHPIGEQQVLSDGLVEHIVLCDVAEEQPLRN